MPATMSSSESKFIYTSYIYYKQIKITVTFNVKEKMQQMHKRTKIKKINIFSVL